MSTVRLNPDCITCLIKSRLEDYPEGTSKEKKIEYMQGVLKAIGEAPSTAAAPVIVQKINEIRKGIFGSTKNYTDIKRHFNGLMMEKLPMMKEGLAKSEDALKLAIQYAMVGNYIDFGGTNTVDEAALQKFLDTAGENHADVWLQCLLYFYV